MSRCQKCGKPSDSRKLCAQLLADLADNNTKPGWPPMLTSWMLTRYARLVLGDCITCVDEHGAKMLDEHQGVVVYEQDRSTVTYVDTDDKELP